ncbi:phosphatase PAP2 family protein [Rhodococcus sp. MS16]|nr:phosphatase PAP2 family protein [Rhodococcus sp. MS16]
MLFTVTVTIVVALTRLYLGVHWLTDVVVGAILATLADTAGGAVFRLLEDRMTHPAIPHPKPGTQHSYDTNINRLSDFEFPETDDESIQPIT